jgi:hypothetical protein
LALSQSALAFNVAREFSLRVALSKSKVMSFMGPPPAASPLRNASRLDPGTGAGAGGALGAGGGFAATAFGALGFCAVHVGGGGFAGLPQANKKLTANNFIPLRNSKFVSLISPTFPVPSRTELMGRL